MNIEYPDVYINVYPDQVIICQSFGCQSAEKLCRESVSPLRRDSLDPAVQCIESLDLGPDCHRHAEFLGPDVRAEELSGAN